MAADRPGFGMEPESDGDGGGRLDDPRLLNHGPLVRLVDALRGAGGLIAVAEVAVALSTADDSRVAGEALGQTLLAKGREHLRCCGVGAAPLPRDLSAGRQAVS